MMERKNIPSPQLRLRDIPADEAEMVAIEEFALTFDGYAFWDEQGESCSDEAKSDCQCLDHLRTRLFFAQRAGRHSDGLHRAEAIPILHALRTELSAPTRTACQYQERASGPSKE
ncbi:hypothetical protein EC9_41380 [Rosistilla ulvae]|uniref:Uncharacterized protein n=1 Tax=Rosistilla ulvae TaxID=1930277 RepID=A0A517M4Z2_9BACT|nr:hypothetical protein [Rosistilla ulvae]QDS89936.1 hypothetical protein EC9_41380 [Rosistilla ulvae]